MPVPPWRQGIEDARNQADELAKGPGPIPDITDQAVLLRQLMRKQQAAALRGRSSTFLTGPRGIGVGLPTSEVAAAFLRAKLDEPPANSDAPATVVGGVRPPGGHPTTPAPPPTSPHPTQPAPPRTPPAPGETPRPPGWKGLDNTEGPEVAATPALAQLYAPYLGPVTSPSNTAAIIARLAGVHG